MTIDLFIIGQQPECCTHSKKFLNQHALISQHWIALVKTKASHSSAELFFGLRHGDVNPPFNILGVVTFVAFHDITSMKTVQFNRGKVVERQHIWGS